MLRNSLLVTSRLAATIRLLLLGYRWFPLFTLKHHCLYASLICCTIREWVFQLLVTGANSNRRQQQSTSSSSKSNRAIAEQRRRSKPPKCRSNQQEENMVVHSIRERYIYANCEICMQKSISKRKCHCTYGNPENNVVRRVNSKTAYNFLRSSKSVSFATF